MLRKISHIFLSFLLLVATAGMAVSKHYCQGDLMSVSLFGKDKNACDMGSCCHDETHVYQVKEDFSSPVVTSVPNLAELDVLGQDLIILENLLKEPETEVTTSYVDFSPPPKDIQTSLSLKQVYLL